MKPGMGLVRESLPYQVLTGPPSMRAEGFEGDRFGVGAAANAAVERVDRSELGGTEREAEHVEVLP